METTSVCASQDGEANSKNADAVVETSDVTEVGITPQPQLANEAVTKVPSQEIPQDTKEHLPQASPALNLLENPTEKVDHAVEILDADLTHPAQDALASEHAHERSLEMENSLPATQELSDVMTTNHEEPKKNSELPELPRSLGSPVQIPVQNLMARAEIPDSDAASEDEILLYGSSASEVMRSLLSDEGQTTPSETTLKKIIETPVPETSSATIPSALEAQTSKVSDTISENESEPYVLPITNPSKSDAESRVPDVSTTDVFNEPRVPDGSLPSSSEHTNPTILNSSSVESSAPPSHLEVTTTVDSDIKQPLPMDALLSKDVLQQTAIFSEIGNTPRVEIPESPAGDHTSQIEDEVAPNTLDPCSVASPSSKEAIFSVDVERDSRPFGDAITTSPVSGPDFPEDAMEIDHHVAPQMPLLIQEVTQKPGEDMALIDQDTSSLAETTVTVCPTTQKPDKVSITDGKSVNGDDLLPSTKSQANPSATLDNSKIPLSSDTSKNDDALASTMSQGATSVSSKPADPLSTGDTSANDDAPFSTISHGAPPSHPEVKQPSPSEKPQSPKDIAMSELKSMKIASINSRNAALEAEIADLRARLEETNKDLKFPAEETVKRHIKLLHDYNDIRDVGQGLIGMIADGRGVRIGELYGEFGVGLKD